MIILTVKRNWTWSVPGKKSLKMNRRDSSATSQDWSWCISTKHEGTTRAHPDNWKMKAKIFSALRADWSPLRSSMPLPSAVCPPYF